VVERAIFLHEDDNVLNILDGSACSVGLSKKLRKKYDYEGRQPERPELPISPISEDHAE
jgi:hypothetical protein